MKHPYRFLSICLIAVLPLCAVACRDNPPNAQVQTRNPAMAKASPTTGPGSVTVLPATRPATRPTIPADVPTVRAKTYPLNIYNRELDGQWQGIGVASDGNCYFSSASHSPRSSGIFGRFDPRKNKVEILAPDLTKLVGEDINNMLPQGKIHTEMVEHDGWIYFATHTAAYWPEAQKDYQGGHVLGYNLTAGKFRDFGIFRPNYTMYSAIGVDSERNTLWVFAVKAEEPAPELIRASTRAATQPGAVDPARELGDARMVRIDLKSGKFQDTILAKGGLRYNSAPYCFIDRSGNCWISLRGKPNQILKISPDGKLGEPLQILPPVRLPGSNEPDPDSAIQQSRSWGWMLPLDRDRVMFCMNSRARNDGSLWIFDTSKTPGPEAFTFVRHIGAMSAGHAIVSDRFYSLQRRDAKPFIRDGWDDGDTFLISASLKNAGEPLVNHGFIADQDGRIPWRLANMASDGKNLYFVGDWKILPGEKGSLKHNRKIREHEKRDQYEEADTAEFFAVILVPAVKQ